MGGDILKMLGVAGGPCLTTAWPYFRNATTRQPYAVHTSDFRTTSHAMHKLFLQQSWVPKHLEKKPMKRKGKGKQK